MCDEVMLVAGVAPHSRLTFSLCSEFWRKFQLRIRSFASVMSDATAYRGVMESLVDEQLC